MTSKEWKEVLLKSGLPLEDSVRKIILTIFDSAYEYNYIKENKEGNFSNFSIDFLATSFNKYLSIHYLIECKYCSPDKKWIFTSNNEAICDKSSFVIDAYDTNNVLNNKYWENFCSYPLVNKGVEIGKKNSNPPQICEAINQLSYAYIHRLFEWLGYEKTKLFLIIPIIVTTAELWRIKENISIEDIKDSKEISEVCTNEKAILLQNFPDNLMKKYYLNHYNKLSGNIKQIIKACHDKNYGGETMEEWLDVNSSYDPNSIIIVNYKAFEKEIKKINKFLMNKRLIISREKDKEQFKKGLKNIKLEGENDL